MRILHVAAAALIALSATGCFGTVTRNTYAIYQRGLTPGSSGPRSFGPSMTAGQFALSFSALGALRNEADAKREGGAPGDVAADKALRFAIATALTEMAELGFTVEARPGSLGTTLASDVQASSFKDNFLVIPGVEGRFTFGETQELRAGFIVEFAAVGIPYQRDVKISTVSTTTDFDFKQTTSSNTSQRKVVDNSYRILARAGPFGMKKLGGVVTLAGGLLVGNHPTLTGFMRTSMSCYTPLSGSNTSCSGESDEDISAVHDVVAFTPFASMALELGAHVAVAAQLFASIFTGYALSGSPTGGGEVAFIVRL